MSDPFSTALIRAAKAICAGTSSEERIAVVEALARVYAPWLLDSRRAAQAVSEGSTMTAAERAQKYRASRGPSRSPSRASRDGVTLGRDEASRTVTPIVTPIVTPAVTDRHENRHAEGGGGEISLSSDSQISDLGSASPFSKDLRDPVTSPGARVGEKPGPIVVLHTAPTHAAAAEPLKLAYQAGIASGWGQRYATPLDQLEVLVEACKAHGYDRNGIRCEGRVLAEWLEFSAREFAEWFRAMPLAERERGRWNLNPRAFLRFLNEIPAVGSEAYQERPEGPRKATGAVEGIGAVLGQMGGKR